jgi:hypothetical protein
MNKSTIAKKIVSNVAGFCVSAVVRKIVTNTAHTDDETRAQELTLIVGSYVLGSMAADHAIGYVEVKYDDAMASWLEIQNKKDQP